MTTYTITQEQLDVAVELLVTALHLVPQGESELFKDTNNAIHMLRGLQPNTQEPVAWWDTIDGADLTYSAGELMGGSTDGLIPLYTHPAPQQPAEPLTDEQINDLMQEADAKWSDADVPMHWARHFARAIEAAHGVKP